jgi:vacuolar iron transporter family protein
MLGRATAADSRPALAGVILPSGPSTLTDTDCGAHHGAVAQQASAVEEPHGGSFASRLNWLRAGVLGANDGLVSTAALVVGVAAATSNGTEIATAGVAGLVAGAVSMALGEYVSVSSQRDSERAQVDQERRELAAAPQAELDELAAIYEAKGLSGATARAVALELTSRDALAAHVDAELNLDPEHLANPVHAAFASAISFVLGAILPMLAILLPPPGIRVWVTAVAVLLALGLAGATSARIGRSDMRSAVLRVVIGGAAGLVLTYSIGHVFGTAVA